MPPEDSTATCTAVDYQIVFISMNGVGKKGQPLDENGNDSTVSGGKRALFELPTLKFDKVADQIQKSQFAKIFN